MTSSWKWLHLIYFKVSAEIRRYINCEETEKQGHHVIHFLYHLHDKLFGKLCRYESYIYHDDVIKWKNFPRYWPFVRGIHRSPVNSPHKGQWRGALIFSLICAWINVWVNNREAGGLRCHCVHYDDIVMIGSVFHNRNDNMIIFLKYTRKCLDEWNFIYLSYTPLPEYRWVNL